MRFDQQVLKKIYHYCAYQERCRKEIVQKLFQLGIPSEEHETWLIHLQQERFWDEARYVHSYVRGKFFLKKWGKRKIIAHLREKEIDEQLMTEAIDREIPEATYLQAIEILAYKKRETLSKTSFTDQKSKISQYLLQKGYEWAVIANVLKRMEKIDE